MNIYKTEFHANCPTNGVRVKYDLQISTEETVPVEFILAQIVQAEDADCYHEEHADRFARTLPGTQVLKAHHHGVDIETLRYGLPDGDMLVERFDPERHKRSLALREHSRLSQEIEAGIGADGGSER